MISNNILNIAPFVVFGYFALMTISHKRTFFDNINHYDQRELVGEIKRLLAANSNEVTKFDVLGFRKKLQEHLSAEMVERVMTAAMSPYEGAVKKDKPAILGKDIAREQRKTAARHMKSRRRSR